MKKRTKLALSGIAAVAGLLALAGCTKSFCSNVDTGRMLYAFDPGITKYEENVGSPDLVFTSESGLSYTVKNVVAVLPTYDKEEKAYVFGSGETKEKAKTYLNEINKSVIDGGSIGVNDNNLPYFAAFDDIVLEDTLIKAVLDGGESVVVDYSTEEGKSKFNRDLSFYSYLKFVEDDAHGVWEKWDKIHTSVVEFYGIDVAPSTDFVNNYKSKMGGYVAQYRTCLTTKTDKYGTYGYSTDGIYIEAKTWGYAWSKGFFEGLLVYPIGWLIDQITFGFRNANVAPGWAALLGIFFVTLIVRGIMMLATFKTTAGNAKMTELQPEITKIQNKYPNSNTSQVEKQRMAEEMNRLYKKNKINPFSSIIIMIVQFPIFICVWGALSGSAALASGTVLGLDLSVTIRQVLFDGANWGPARGYAAVTALFLFLLMAGAQAVSMLLPQWIQKAKAKKVAKLGTNPAQKSQNNKMKWFTYIMLAMIIFMGFSLVSAMGVYWLVGAVISTAQTLITQAVTEHRRKKK